MLIPTSVATARGEGDCPRKIRGGKKKSEKVEKFRENNDKYERINAK